MGAQITLQQFRGLQLPVVLHRAGQIVGVTGVLYWFWWVFIEKGFLQTLLSDSLEMQVILLGLPLALILPAIYYAAVFVLLRVLFWLLIGGELAEDSVTDEE